MSQEEQTILEVTPKRPHPNEVRSEWTLTFPSPGENIQHDRTLTLYNDKNKRWVVSIHACIGPCRAQTSDGWDEFAASDNQGLYILRVLRGTYTTKLHHKT